MDKKKPVEKDAADSLLVKKMGETVESSPSQFRTVEHIDAATGDKTRLRTKGGNPQVVVERTPPKKQESGCPKPPFVEVGFKYAAEPGTDPSRNPYTVTSGYRTWHGEPNPALPISPTNPKKIKRFNFSHDGLFCIEARKPKRLSFKDANNKKVELLLAEKPNDPDDTANTENQEYATSGAGTFVNVAKARATAQGTDAADFKYSEGRYKYREWYPPEWQDIGWALKFVPNSAFKFMTKRLRKIAVLLTKKGSDVVKSIEWIFCNKDTQAYTGTPSAPPCAENNLREKSFAGRSFYSPNGHLSEVVMRARYAGLNPPYSGGDEVKFSLKRPGSILMNIDPEWVIPETGSTTHPGADDCIDIQDFAAFGNAYHGLVWWNGSSYTFYKDSSKTDTIPIAPANLTPVTLRYYNFSGVLDTTDDEHVIRRKLPDNTYSYEAFYKDAIMHYGSTLPAASTANYARITQDEVLYKDPAGTVWVVAVECLPFNYLSEIYWPMPFYLTRMYGDIGTDFDWNNHGGGAGQTNLGLLGGATTLVGGPYFDRYGKGGIVVGYLIPGGYGASEYYANAQIYPHPGGKKGIAAHKVGFWPMGIHGQGGIIYKAYQYEFSGTGAIEADPANGVTVGQGISLDSCVSMERDPFPRPNTRTYTSTNYVCATSQYDPINNPDFCPQDENGSQTINCGGTDWTFHEYITTKNPVVVGHVEDGESIHFDLDYFWNDEGFPVAISVRITSDLKNERTTTGTFVPRQVLISALYCSGNFPVDEYTIIDEELPVTSVVSSVYTYTIELLVGGALVDKIGYQVTSTGGASAPVMPWWRQGAGFTGTDPGGTTSMIGGGSPSPVISGSLMNLVPTIKAIPNVAGATKAAKGTKDEIEWQRCITSPATFTDIAYCLMWEGKTTGIETAIKDCPTKLVFRDAVLETTMESFLPVPIDATNELYSPNGWAYNPRTKELILVPNGEVGYFF